MSTELVIIRAATIPELVTRISDVVSFLDRVPESRLKDIAYTCAQDVGEKCIALVVDSVLDLRTRLVSARNRLLSPTTKRLRIKVAPITSPSPSWAKVKVNSLSFIRA